MFVLLTCFTVFLIIGYGTTLYYRRYWKHYNVKFNYRKRCEREVETCRLIECVKTPKFGNHQKCQKEPQLTSELFLSVEDECQAEKSGKDQLKIGEKMVISSPQLQSDTSENMEEVSLFDADSKDSGYCEDISEEKQRRSLSPCLEDSELDSDEATILSFPLEGLRSRTPGKSNFQTTKRRLFASPVRSPCTATATSLKRLKLFDTETDIDCLPALDFSDKLLAEDSDHEEPTSVQLLAKFDQEVTEAQKDLMKQAVERSEDEELIGDFSKSYALPLIRGAHPELKSISAETVKDLLNGQFDAIINSFVIVDSRFPYEFEGGHIRGARNIYMMEECIELLNAPTKPNEERHILIFHCEFSKERGPNMVRNLRKEDRTRNAVNYPALTYPEIYILEGGYKNFFESFPSYCDPADYKQMLDPAHVDDMRFFKKKSRTSECVINTAKKGIYSRLSKSSAQSSRLVRKALSTDF
ncbi:M-phase inducer phosphatase-like [Euwallacea similis]|uniref:M-phase inducer phosphatase-like n=1 Tax=Euwallacea similis TaxID=1736056 RepID=UPI00344C52C8